jgi:hypothetical protein
MGDRAENATNRGKWRDAAGWEGLGVAAGEKGLGEAHRARVGPDT